MTKRTAILLGVLVATALGAGQSHAVSGQTPENTPVATETPLSNSLSIGSAEEPNGRLFSVDLTAVVPGGLAGWDVIVYAEAPAHVSFYSCATSEDFVSACFIHPNGVTGGPRVPTVRLVGASGTGVIGENVLGTIWLNCDSEGSSTLQVQALTFVDATIGGPQDIPVATHSGTVECTHYTPITPIENEYGGGDAPTETETSPQALPQTGTGSPSGGPPEWVIAGLIGLGIGATALAWARSKARNQR